MHKCFLLLFVSLVLLPGKVCCSDGDGVGELRFHLGQLSEVGGLMGEGLFQLRKLLQEGEEVTDEELSDYVFDVLANDGDLNAPGPENLPPLMVAAHHGFTNLIKTLLDLGVDVDSRDQEGYTALMYAARSGRVDTTKALIKADADVNLQAPEDGLTAIYLASASGETKVLEVLIEAGGDIELSSAENITPLIVATVQGHVKIVEVLLKNNADISVASNTGDTAILRAVQFDSNIEKAKANHIKIMELLLEAGADPNSKNTQSQSLVWIAVLGDDPEAVALLLKYSVDVNSATKDGSTPLFIAVLHCETCLELLLKAGADRNPVFPENGWTPLHFAAALGELGACEKLVEYNADKSIKDSKGETPFDVAGILNPELDSETKDSIRNLLEQKGVPSRGSGADDKVRTKGAGIDPMYVLIVVFCAAAFGCFTILGTCCKRFTKQGQNLDGSNPMISACEASGSSEDIERGQYNGGAPQVVHYVLNPMYHEGQLKHTH